MKNLKWYWWVLIIAIVIFLIWLIFFRKTPVEKVNALIVSGDCTNLKVLMPKFNSLITEENLSQFDDSLLDKSFNSTIPSLKFNGIAFSSATRQDKINAILNFKKLANNFASKC